MNQSVLLADDDTHLRGVFALFLRSLGWHVAEASNGTEALKTFRKSRIKPSLVVLDIRMHNDGLSTCRTFKTDTFINKTPPKIAILSAADRDKYAPLARRVGADMVLSKPITPQNLHVMLQRLLSRDPEQLAAKSVHQEKPVVAHGMAMAMLFKLPRALEGPKHEANLAIALENTCQILREEYGPRCSIKKTDKRSALLLYVENNGGAAQVNARAQRVLKRLDMLQHCIAVELKAGRLSRYGGISLEALTRLAAKPSLPTLTRYLENTVQQSAQREERGVVTAVERFTSQAV
ncbi:response regulator [Acanthopleuribacter pedis]|uniref:Response regulator n=1 Tax=Acanthopleuribacter pedis TaxID=442870 RepID=A0A8J7Q593_9BACT|nr:response regulator [Acanthopleuribacter pedis]MBO1319320.1 response regulator [Acanthopleuribacter pedis]